MNVYIAQLLCPARHCYLAGADEFENPQQAEILRLLLQERFDKMIASEGFNPWCHLCKSRKLHIEIAKTGFQTLAEAAPHLAAAQMAQLASRAQWDRQKN